MRGTRLHIALLVLALAAAVLAGCGGGEATKAGGSGAPVTLRIGTDDGPGRPASDAIEEFARQVKELSGGKLRIEPVWQAAGQGNRDWDQRVARMVVRGDLDLGMIPARAWDTEGVMSLRALHAPFLVTSDELLDQVVKSELAAEMLAGLDRAGVVGLALLPESLRHPFGFGKPLRSPGDYAGALVRTPRSDVSYALFEALGARADDLDGDAFDQAIADGSLAAAESAFVLASSLPAATVATGNVTFFPKVNSLVVNADVFGGLHDEQRGILEEAAARTLAWAIGSTSTDAEAAKAFCGSGGAVVLASGADVAALEQATSPVYAELERDAETKSLIEAIRALKSQVAVSATARVEACEPSGGGGAAAGTEDVSALNGVWRANPSYEEGIAAGLPPSLAAQEIGVETIRMENGRYEWSWLARDGEHLCSGTYEVSGDRVVFTDPPECGSPSWEAVFELVGDEIHWRDVKSHQAGDPVDQLVRELIHEPWTKLTDLESEQATVPSGVYRMTISEEEFLEKGILPEEAIREAGIYTFTLDNGHFILNTQNEFLLGDCEGTYSGSGARISFVLTNCGGGEFFTAAWTFDSEELRFENVQAADALVVATFGTKPWKKIG